MNNNDDEGKTSEMNITVSETDPVQNLYCRFASDYCLQLYLLTIMSNTALLIHLTECCFSPPISYLRVTVTILCWLFFIIFLDDCYFPMHNFYH